MRQWQRWGVKLPGQNYPRDSNIPKGVCLDGITEGFDFLGQNIRMYAKNKLLMWPSKDSIKSEMGKLLEIIVKHRGSQAAVLIRNLNRVITGWASYHKHACSKKIFFKLDRILWRNIWNWA